MLKAIELSFFAGFLFVTGLYLVDYFFQALAAECSRCKFSFRHSDFHLFLWLDTFSSSN